MVAAEAVLLVLQGVLELMALDRSRLVMGGTTAAFFVLYGAALGYCARMLARLRSWARAPVVVAQILQILVGGSFLGGGTTAVGVGLVAAAVLVLAGVFHPASLQALAEDPR